MAASEDEVPPEATLGLTSQLDVPVNTADISKDGVGEDDVRFLDGNGEKTANGRSPGATADLEPPAHEPSQNTNGTKIPYNSVQEEDEEEEEEEGEPRNNSPFPGGVEGEAPPAKKTKKKGSTSKKSYRKGWKRGAGRQSGGGGGREREEDDLLLVTPAPPPQQLEDREMVLSMVHKASQVVLSEDRLSASSSKGYRMVRATRGVVEGAWYFEIDIVHLGEEGHTRLGWCTQRGDPQAPVGYDCNSYAYRDLEGCKVHQARREPYGESYKTGDTVGFYINLPGGAHLAPQQRQLVRWKGQPYYIDDGEGPKTPVPGSEITFYMNGVCQGKAFTDIFGGRYYPAASIFTLPKQTEKATVKFNFGPNFKFFPKDWGDRPVPRPMSETKPVEPGGIEGEFSNLPLSDRTGGGKEKEKEKENEKEKEKEKKKEEEMEEMGGEGDSQCERVLEKVRDALGMRGREGFLEKRRVNDGNQKGVKIGKVKQKKVGSEEGKEGGGKAGRGGSNKGNGSENKQRVSTGGRGYVKKALRGLVTGVVGEKRKYAKVSQEIFAPETREDIGTVRREGGGGNVLARNKVYTEPLEANYVRNERSERSEKSEKSERSEKSEKSERSEKSFFKRMSGDDGIWEEVKVTVATRLAPPLRKSRTMEDVHEQLNDLKEGCGQRRGISVGGGIGGMGGGGGLGLGGLGGLGLGLGGGGGGGGGEDSEEYGTMGEGEEGGLRESSGGRGESTREEGRVGKRGREVSEEESSGSRGRHKGTGVRRWASQVENLPNKETELVRSSEGAARTRAEEDDY